MGEQEEVKENCDGSLRRYGTVTGEEEGERRGSVGCGVERGNNM